MTGLYESRMSPGYWFEGIAWIRSGRGDDALELVPHLSRDGAVDRRMGTVRLAVDHGRAGVRGGANRHVQGDLAQERYSELLGLVARAAMAENVGFRAALGTLEVAHVLDNAEHGHIDLLEHREPSPRVDQGQVLRGRDDDGALQRHVLRQS